MKVLLSLLLAGALAGCAGMAPGPHGHAGWSRSHAGMHRHHGPMYAPLQHHGALHGGRRAAEECRMGMAGALRGADANGDGMLSKEEFLQAQAAAYDAMRKNDRGQVALADLASCPMLQRP